MTESIYEYSYAFPAVKGMQANKEYEYYSCSHQFAHFYLKGTKYTFQKNAFQIEPLNNTYTYTSILWIIF